MVNTYLFIMLNTYHSCLHLDHYQVAEKKRIAEEQRAADKRDEERIKRV